MIYLMSCVLLFVSYLHDLDFHAHNSGSRVIYRRVMSRDRCLRGCLVYVSTCHFDAFFFHFDAPPHLTADLVTSLRTHTTNYIALRYRQLQILLQTT